MRILIPALQGQHPQTGEALFSEEQSIENRMRQEAAQAEGDFETDYQEPEKADYPLGEQPILLTRITFKELGSDNPELNLEPENGPGIGLPFQPDVLAILLKIFSKALDASNWQLDLEPILQLPKESRLQ
ncbi:hypothetical protein QCB45_08090 [Thiomicrorhabdus sp. ZW0627]|uniref:hypothetical protein n=1 Tax=Thiomicrorhabdus sp. ZW0627 TaxID=3039774 RepID=UPI0024369E79|nr:hypothetical protein [Thiomicrorhabdus sp. ZW0627]MDG6774291.1 hypothetical protein [Thiomicrorhabdus sp. ZW0627]